MFSSARRSVFIKVSTAALAWVLAFRDTGSWKARPVSPNVRASRARCVPAKFISLDNATACSATAALPALPATCDANSST